VEGVEAMIRGDPVDEGYPRSASSVGGFSIVTSSEKDAEGPSHVSPQSSAEPSTFSRADDSQEPRHAGAPPGQGPQVPDARGPRLPLPATQIVGPGDMQSSPSACLPAAAPLSPVVETAGQTSNRVQDLGKLLTASEKEIVEYFRKELRKNGSAKVVSLCAEVVSLICAIRKANSLVVALNKPVVFSLDVIHCTTESAERINKDLSEEERSKSFLMESTGWRLAEALH
jgi:hypothetical protein